MNFPKICLLKIAVCCLLVSCSNKKATNDSTLLQNFDDLQMWDKTAQLTDEQARSGKYATYTDSTHEYSQTFEMPLSDAQTKGYKFVRVKAWCMKAEPDCKTALKLSVESPEKNTAEATAYFSNLQAANTWGQLTVNLDLPAQAPADSKIKVYCWSSQKEKTYMDDVQIEFSK